MIAPVHSGAFGRSPWREPRGKREWLLLLPWLQLVAVLLACAGSVYLAWAIGSLHGLGCWDEADRCLDAAGARPWMSTGDVAFWIAMVVAAVAGVALRRRRRAVALAALAAPSLIVLGTALLG